MSTNYSSLINDSLSLPSSPTNFSFPLFMYCFFVRPSSLIFTAFIITYASAMLPLCITILYQGLLHWWQKWSATSVAPMSHCDCFTYNVVVMELLGVIGCVISCGGIYMEDLVVLALGLLPACFLLLGEAFFHVLTCVERYLAVVHPIFYLSSKSTRGIIIRNLCIAFGWLLSILGMGLLMVVNLFSIIDLCLLISAIMIVSFCSLSVLFVLIRPGPGDQSGDKENLDQLKKRAFYTIMAILGVLVLRFTAGLVRSIFYMSYDDNACVVMTIGFWFYMPSSFVLPMLFLHRTGKLMCCKDNTQGKQKSEK